ncbi:MAG: hypothetical protein ASARMPRED_001582 [Alectoria sarmentosa]|nr:MAG: hypothetical protein ASARMPRED_001582 [Alectoria sarmentosa]
MLTDMKFSWILPIFSLLGLQAVQASPLASTSSTSSSPLSAVSGASTISVAPSLSWTANLSTNATLRSSLFINGSANTANISRPVTVVKTIDLIPQPRPSSPSAGASESFGPIKNLIPNAPLSASKSQQAKLPTISAPAKLEGSSGINPSSRSQLQMPQSFNQASKRPGLQPIVVGGITYAPAHAAHTYSNGIPWEEKSRPSQTQPGAVEWHEYFAKHESNFDQGNRDGGGSESPADQAGLPPVIVGGLTYTPLRKGFESGWRTSAPEMVAGLSSESEQLATSPLVEVWSTMSQVQGGSIAASPQYAPTPDALGLVQTQSPSLTSPSTASFISNGALLPGSPPIMVNSASYSLNPATSPSDSAMTTTTGVFEPTSSFAISGQSVIPASPFTFTVAGDTFTAYPSGLAIDGTEVFEGSTAITVSGTPISLGSSDIVIGTRTIPIASITGLGPALSSGLSTTASAIASGDSSGPTLSSQSRKSSRQSVAGHLKVLGNTVIAWLVLIALVIVV